MNDCVLRGRRRRGLFCFTLTVCTCGFAAAGQPRAPAVSPAPLTVPAYAQEIGRWCAELAQAKDRPEKVSQLRRQVPPDWQVTVDAQLVKIPTDWLQSGLELAEKNPKAAAQSIDRLLTRMQALRREAEALAGEAGGPDASAAGKLRAILARPEFRQVHGPTWLDRMVQHVREWLVALWERLARGLSGHERIAWMARLLPWILLVCAAGGLLVWMVRLLLRRSAARLMGLSVPKPAPPPSWQQMAEAARKFASTGEYREAIKLAYLAAVNHLQDLKLWSVDPARTHREYLRMIRHEQPEYEPLALLTREFELTWYGSQPATRDGFQIVVNQLERLGCA